MLILALIAALLTIPGFSPSISGPSGGVVLEGVFPDAAAPSPLRRGFVYLPPGFSTSRRYPVIYLLHGLPGDPDEYVDAVRRQDVADALISEGAARPFIAIVPAAGPDVHYNGEWAGPWESYLLRVVDWADRTLPTIRNPAGRTLAGLSAGGYGAVDIGLRNRGLFGRIESWSGYFTPLHDGPFKRADGELLAENDPTKLAPAEARELRRARTRFFLSSGPTHSHWAKEEQTIAFAQELRLLALPVTLELFPSRRGEWTAQIDAGLRWAFRPRASAAPARDRCPPAAAAASLSARP